jgi:hypothetical protein
VRWQKTENFDRVLWRCSHLALWNGRPKGGVGETDDRSTSGIVRHVQNILIRHRILPAIDADFIVTIPLLVRGKSAVTNEQHRCCVPGCLRDSNHSCIVGSGVMFDGGTALATVGCQTQRATSIPIVHFCKLFRLCAVWRPRRELRMPRLYAGGPSSDSNKRTILDTSLRVSPKYDR